MVKNQRNKYSISLVTKDMQVEQHYFIHKKLLVIKTSNDTKIMCGG